MASLKEIMNVDDDHADDPLPVKRVLEPGPRPPHGPESSFPSRSAFHHSSHSPSFSSSSLAAASRSPPALAYPQTARPAASPSSAPLSLASDPGFRRRSTASADSMDSYHGHTYLPDRTAAAASGASAMRPNLPPQQGQQGETPIKLTPITRRVSKAKKGIPVHECDICQPPKVCSIWALFCLKGIIWRHQLSHNPPDLRCTVRGCDKAFHRDDLLKRHIQRHEQEQQMASQPLSMRVSPSEPGSGYGPTSYQGLVPMHTTSYGGHEPSSRPGSGPSGSDSAWPSRSMASGAHGQLPGQDQYSLGSSLVGQGGSSSALLPGFDQPRTSPSMMGTIPSLQAPEATLRWPDTTTSAPTSSASSSAFSTPSRTSRLTQLPTRTLADDWVSHMPLAPSSSDASSAATTYSSLGFGYESSLTDSMGGLLPPGGYHDEASLYGSRDFGNSTVRSLSPPRMAVAQSSETLVTAPTPLSTDRLIEPRFQGWQTGVPKITATTTTTTSEAVATDSFGPLGLTQAARRAIPTYLEVFWEKAAPIYPIVHRSSLEVAVTIPEHRELLACAMAAIATQYLDDPDDRVNGSQLHTYAWNKAKTFTKTDPWPLPIVQTILLCEYYARYRGRKKGAHIASPHFARLYQMMNDPDNTFAPIPSDGSVEQRWRVWIDMETRRRIFAACFLLDAHSMHFLEQPPTKIRAMDYACHATLAIPFSSTTARMWDAQRAKEWAGFASSALPVRTLASISLQDVTRENVQAASRFDGAVLLAGLSLQLPRRRSLTKVDLLSTPTDIDPLIRTIASLFPESGTANTYMALQHTPLHTLLSVSGDSWVFNNKVPNASWFAEHRQELQHWQASSSAAVATAFAARALKAFLTRCVRFKDERGEPTLRPLWIDISDYWAFYVCTLICWACGGLEAEADYAPFSLSTALQSVDTVAQLQPDQVHEVVDRHHAHRIVGLGRRLLMKDCLGGRSILLADAVNVLRKLDGGRGREW